MAPSGNATPVRTLVTSPETAPTAPSGSATTVTNLVTSPETAWSPRRMSGRNRATPVAASDTSKKTATRPNAPGVGRSAILRLTAARRRRTTRTVGSRVTWPWRAPTRKPPNHLISFLFINVL